MGKGELLLSSFLLVFSVLSVSAATFLTMFFRSREKGLRGGKGVVCTLRVCFPFLIPPAVLVITSRKIQKVERRRTRIVYRQNIRWIVTGNSG